MRITINTYQPIHGTDATMSQNTLSYFFLIKCTFLRQYSIDEISSRHQNNGKPSAMWQQLRQTANTRDLTCKGDGII
ncbi:hypothetical protein HEAR1285 [Herminiimonas arsenicoxydans]|uniref:Uncharacterized protein n=1 Tax=Herminiimonas arsenicoxydans TaxID=204773 RepID=A4G4M1_HERAR|nr:hypothetical protein HEAR1285 [Herminiimonas arsenicoxydans]